VCVAEWRQRELSRIDETLTGAERKLALTQLLDEEAELISCIARRRYDVIEDIKKMSIKTFLKKASRLFYPSVCIALEPSTNLQTTENID